MGPVYEFVQKYVQYLTFFHFKGHDENTPEKKFN